MVIQIHETILQNEITRLGKFGYIEANIQEFSAIGYRPDAILESRLGVIIIEVVNSYDHNFTPDAIQYMRQQFPKPIRFIKIYSLGEHKTGTLHYLGKGKQGSFRVCFYCGYKWTSRVEQPKQCPRCKRYDWKEVS